jgi:SAM-dependent methyltransferase
MPQTPPSELACPRCSGPLRHGPDGARCAKHGVVAHLDPHGVWVFDESDAYWGEVDRGLMRRVLESARRHTWRAALETELRPVHPDLMNYVHHPARADWQVLLPLDRERTVVLDVGAGWGANSFGIAPHVQRVYAAEKVAERAAWIALRAAQDAVTSVIPVRAELQALPFAPGSLDVVVVNGVLEWAGLVDPNPHGGSAASPRVLQERFLRQLASLLRPGGWMYVGIENRFGHMFLRGTPDHQGLRYTSLMPKPVARAYTWLRAAASPRTHHVERDYRTWIYSFAGYSALLEQCGFADVQRYAAVPGYNVPTLLVPLATRGPMRYLTDRVRPAPGPRAQLRRRAARILADTGLEAWLTSCYAITARRPERAS